MATQPIAAPRARHRGFRAYPLHSIPREWTIDVDTFRDATAAERIKENMVRQTRSGVSSACAAIFAGADPPYVHLRLAKLTEDAIEMLDTKTGVEELIETKEGQYFADSVHFVVNSKNGMAMGEYRPNSLSVLGKWPGALISHAFQKLGTVPATAAQPVTFEPFPTKDFLKRALGRAVKKFALKMGALSPETMEQAGISSEVMEQLILEEGGVLSFDMDISVNPTSPLTEGMTQRLALLAGKLSSLGAQELKVTLEDKEQFDLLNDNLVYYAVGFDAPADATRGEIRTKTLTELRQRLVQHEAELLAMLN